LIIYNKNSLTNIFTDITINGPVKKPGTYSLENNKKLSDLIIAAGGFVTDVQKVKISVARINPDSFSPILYNIPSKKVGNKFIKISSLENPENEVNNFVLQSRDIVNIYSDPKDELPGTIKISGAVYYPGNYPIISSKEKVSDIINRAGGLLPEAYPMASSFIRDGKTVRLSFEEIINNPTSKENFTLMPGDSIEILIKSNIVRIIGEVNNPGTFKFYNNRTLRDYIKIAGGVTTNAEHKEIWIAYPNGTSKQLKRFLPSPKVYDGSVITVGREEDTEPFDETEYAKELTQIFANLAQVLLLFTAVQN